MPKCNILIVDDHSLMIEGYKSILMFNNSDCELAVTAAKSCEEAHRIIIHKQFPGRFDLIFLDLMLPGYQQENLASGEDLARLIKKTDPLAKIVILTSKAEAIVLYHIVKKINPSGLLVKSDFTAEEFLAAFDLILAGNQYYSATVRQALQQITSEKMYLDNYNRQIITLLSQGVKTKNFPEYIPLSISAIDKRKVQIKEFLLIEKGNDEDILRAAKKAGLI